MDSLSATEPNSPPAEAADLAQTPVPRACDACRTRKIRCNRESPCAHCLNAKIQCTHSDARPKEKRSRILLTHQYEQKIDHIDRRLDGVLCLLRELKTQLSSHSPKSVESAAATIRATCSSSPASHATHTAGTLVEGNSSLTAHSVFANDLLQKVVSKDSESRPEMRERLDALGHIVEAMKKQPVAHEMTYPHANPVQPAALQGCELPPIDMTLQVLKLAKSHRQFGLAWVYEVFDMDRFPETCLAVYMAEDDNRIDFITVNIILRYLFWGYATLIPDKREEYVDCSRRCGVNAETALSSLPLHLPVSNNVIIALSLGAFYAVELSKPSLAWILTSKASELCQTLGYHRVESYKNEPLEDTQYNQFLFWVVYTMDKSLSLRLGRSSTIQDRDVTAPYSEQPDELDPGRGAITSFFHLWVMASKLQGQIYEQLYCPEAIAQPEAVRQSRVPPLVRGMEELDALTHEATERWDRFSRDTAGDDMTDFFIISDHVLRLSTLTLIHRAIPNPVGSPTTFTAECVRAARETLARHQDCMAVVERSKISLFSTYMSWTILFAPFVPFIVLFCQVIETKDETDLVRLQAFAASLQPYMAVSEEVDRHRRLFQVLYSVASHYVDSHKGTDREEQQQPSMDVDTYLAALGFSSQTAPEQPHEAQYLAPAGASETEAANQEFQRGVNPMIWMGNSAQLEDWFYSNEQIMALMEDGVSDDPIGWGTQ